jgi:cytochrome oxidase Cu insertion factor (SCO1/SenC/PrrC family)
MKKLQISILAISALGILIVLGLLTNDLMKSNTATEQVSATPMLSIEYDLINQEGKPTTQLDFAGRYQLVYFGFAFCPDICPFTLDVMSEALNQIGDRADIIQPIFISLDPARDTPDELATYIDSFFPGFIALTGTDAQVEAAAKSFKVYFQKVEDPNSAGGYVIDHTSIVYVINPDGDLVHFFTHKDTAETIATKLNALLSK